ncbi:MAG: Sua5/YciO/YrdC/YwlC family protein, partial [Candidatus Kerfeldbacteria bacterium]|nr:Sua5/YciO/YrdC/YwlC family protein [Candidatus Kerfeldbacteria bacterium]
LVLPAKGHWPKGIMSKSNMIGLRVPGSGWLRRLVTDYALPLTATSANLAGEATLYEMTEVKNLLAGCGLKYIVGNRRLTKRPTSTVVRVVGGKWRILRPGAISLARLRSVVR